MLVIFFKVISGHHHPLYFLAFEIMPTSKLCFLCPSGINLLFRQDDWGKDLVKINYPREENGLTMDNALCHGKGGGQALEKEQGSGPGGFFPLPSAQSTPFSLVSLTQFSPILFPLLSLPFYPQLQFYNISIS